MIDWRLASAICSMVVSSSRLITSGDALLINSMGFAATSCARSCGAELTPRMLPLPDRFAFKPKDVTASNFFRLDDFLCNSGLCRDLSRSSALPVVMAG